MISKETFKQKVAEGFIVGVMVSLTLALSGIIWNAFSQATERLGSAEGLLRGQSEKLEKQSRFNAELIQELDNEQNMTETQLTELAADLRRTREGLEGKLNELADSVNSLVKDQDGPASLKKDFGKLESFRIETLPRQQAVDFGKLGTEFQDIIKQAPIDR